MAKRSGAPGDNGSPGCDMSMRERSGEINATDPLVDFLYTLMRDHIPPGTLEELVHSASTYAAEDKKYTNGWLAAYARDLAKRLRGRTPDAAPPTLP